MRFQYFLKFSKRHLNIYVIGYVVPNLYTNKAKSATYMLMQTMSCSQFMSIACSIAMNCGISSEEIFNGIRENTNFIFQHLDTNSVNYQILKWKDIEF